MTAAIIAGIAAFLVVGFVLARQTSARKKEATQSLAEEKKTVGAYSITDMAEEEISELRLRDIEGTDDLPSNVILKVWKDSEPVWSSCDRDDLRYVVAEGVEPRQALVADVHLECSSAPTVEDPAPDPDVADE